jgi:hypothetical protein
MNHSRDDALNSGAKVPNENGGGRASPAHAFLSGRYFTASVISEVQAPVGALVMIFWARRASAVRW